MPTPKNIPPPPKGFTSEKGVELAEALQIMLPKELGLSDAAAKNKLKTKNYSWQNPKALSEYVKGITGQGSIKEAEYVLSQWQENYTETPSHEQFTMTAAPEYAVESNTLAPDQLKQFQEEAERVEKNREAAVISAESDVRAAIKRKQEIYADQIKRAEAAKKDFEKQTKFAAVKEVGLTEDEQNQIEALRQQSKSNPEEAVKVVSQELERRLGDSVPEEARDVAALNVVASLQTGYAPVIQAAVTENVSQDTKNGGEKEVEDWVETLRTRSDAEVAMSKDITQKAFGTNFQKAVFPEVDVSDSPQPGFIPVSLAYLPSEAVKTIQQKSQILNNPFLKEVDYTDKWFGSQLARLNGDGSEVQGSVSFVYFKPQGQVNWQEMGGPAKMGQITGTGEALGAVKGLAGGVAKKAVTKGLTKAITGFLSKAAAPETGGLSLAIGAAINWVVDKIGQKNIKKWSLFALSVPVIAAGVIVGVPIATTVGAGLATVGLANAFGVTPAAIGQAVFSFLGAAVVATLGAISTPILIALISFPVAVSLILFIINSGAYVVPESSLASLRGQDNPYMLVTKVANPDKIDNPSGAVTVNYTVTITALKNQLTNLKITDTSCTVTKKNKSGASCPVEKIEDLPENLTITPSSSYSFSFAADFGPNLSDSLVFDSVTVTGDTVEEQGISTTGSETVCVGDCPTSCVKVSDNADTWPGNIRSITEKAALSVAGKYPGLAAKYCSEGEINLCFKPSAVKIGGWHVHNQFGDDCDVYFKAGVLQNSGDAEFMLGHELTHHIQAISGAESEYVQSGALRELPFCSYEDSTETIEGMAEAVGLYVSIPSWGGCVGNYRTKYPKNYNFAKGFVE